MYTRGNPETITLLDRIVGGIFGALFGGIIGTVVFLLLAALFMQLKWLPWVPALGFGVYGFISPIASRDKWSNGWQQWLPFLFKWRR